MGESEAVRGVMTGEETCRSPDEPRGVEQAWALPILIRYRRLMRAIFRAWLCGNRRRIQKNENNEHNENNNNNENNENSNNIQNIDLGRRTLSHAEVRPG